MQSGISASQELVSQFNDLLSNKHFGLLVTIKGEQLQPIELLTSSSTDFNSNITSLLTPHIKTNEALYILLRRYDTSPALVAVTYVPDAAPVRQKMLFASTRLTLTRELGTEHFRETIFATVPQELTPQGFEKHDAHTKLDAPLTEEERSLSEVKRAEQEAGQGTGVREIHLSKSLSMPVASDALLAMGELSSNGFGRGLIMLKINAETESIELVPSIPSPPSSISDLVQIISPTEPRFTFYKYTHSYEGVESSPVLFFYTCPAGSFAAAGKGGIKNRMLYPLMKRAVLDVATNEAGMVIEKKFEVEEPSEITEEAVLAELHPKVEVKKAFSRPKRPGR